MIKKTKATIGFLLFLLTAQPLPADQAAQAGRQFLLIPLDARESGMGGSNAAFSNGSMDLFSNPALLVDLQREQLSLSHLSWFGGTNEESAAYARAIDGAGVIGGGLSFYWIPSFDNTAGVEAAFSSDSYQGVLGYAGRFGLKDLAFGASLRYVGAAFGGLEKTDDLGIDLGLFYETNWKPLKLGAVFKNINLLTSAQGSFPLLCGFGASLGDADKLFSVELDRISGQDFQFQGGGEYWIGKVVAFRAGLKVQDALNAFVQPSIGVGVRLGENYRFDYAVSNIGDLGLVHWLTMGIYFGSPGRAADLPVKAESAPVVRQMEDHSKPVKAVPASNAAPAEARFPINAQVINNTVYLSWDAQILNDSPASGYNVYGSLFQGAGFKKMTDSPVTPVHWSGEIGLRGITYYFKVRMVGADGQETKSSEIKDVEIP